MSLRLMIADDEPALLAWLERCLAEVAPDMEIVARAVGGDEAIACIESLRPDVAFLDIRMPGLSGLEVAARITVPCRVVFVTAYDEFAVQAFEQAALDYLLKPVTTERLARSVERLRTGPSGDVDMLRQLLARIPASLPTPPPLRWLRVGSNDSVRLLDVAEVDHFEAADKYTVVHAAGQAWLIRTPLKELEGQLDPQAFWRVHRGTLVRVAAIREVRRDIMGRLWLHLHNDSPPLAVSRSFTHLFRQM